MFNFLQPEHLITAFGLFGIFCMIFLESGVFFGFFLPGDSLLFAGGIFASQGYFNIGLLLAVVILAAILGDNFGYYFGRRVGVRFFKDDDSFFLSKNHLVRAEKFYKKYGPPTIILARFTPIVRTFTPIVAGAARMRYKTFVLYNIVGAILWAFSVPLVGYFLHQKIPQVDALIVPIVIVAMIASFVPVLWQLLKKYRIL